MNKEEFLKDLKKISDELYDCLDRISVNVHIIKSHVNENFLIKYSKLIEEYHEKQCLRNPAISKAIEYIIDCEESSYLKIQRLIKELDWLKSFCLDENPIPRKL